MESGPPRFWRTPKAEGLLSMSGDTLVVSGCFPDPEELAAFCAVSGAKKLRGRSQTLEAAAKWLGWPIQIRQILSAAGTLRPSVIPPGFCEPSPREVYPLLQAVFGLPKEDFAPWYCEISHKLRHRQGALLGVRAAGKMAATAGIYHQNRKAALIGSVALTLPSGGGDMRQHWYFRWQTGPGKKAAFHLSSARTRRQRRCMSRLDLPCGVRSGSAAEIKRLVDS